MQRVEGYAKVQKLKNREVHQRLTRQNSLVYNNNKTIDKMDRYLDAE